MLNWVDLDPATVERAIKALLCELYPGLRTVDGSGGDRGRDAYLVLDDESSMRIFEIKSYTRTLNNSQKSKILQSLAKALQHAGVTEWVLVMPHDHTPKEDEWFQQRTAAAAAPVKVEWWGRAWLDRQFADRGDLQRYVEGAESRLLQRASEYQMERAVLARGLPDLAARQAGLGTLADELSPYWRVESGTLDGQTTIRIVEKRPGAAEADPIRVDFRIAAREPSDEAEARTARERYEHVLAFGGHIAIENRHLEGIDVTASQETARLFGSLLTGPIESVEFGTPPEPDRSVMAGWFEAVSQTGRVTAAARITSYQRRSGNQGTTIYARDESGSVHLALQVPHPDAADHPQPTVQITVGPFTGAQPDVADKAVDVLLAAGVGDRLKIRFGRTLQGIAEIPQGTAEISNLKNLAVLITDLKTLQDHARIDAPIPGDRPLAEIEALHVVARALRGEKVRLGMHRWQLALQEDRVDDFLEADASRPDRAMLATIENGQLDLAGRTYALGPIAYYAPNLVLANRSELRSRTWEGAPVARYIPSDGEGIYLLPIASPRDEPRGKADGAG